MVTRHGVTVGAVWGLLLAATYSVLLLLLVGGKWLVRWILGREPPASAADLPVSNLMLAYILGGITAGVVLGVLFREGRDDWRSITIGFAMAVPLVAAVRLAIHGIGEWVGGDHLQIVIRGLAMGTALGVGLWLSGHWLRPPDSLR